MGDEIAKLLFAFEADVVAATTTGGGFNSVKAHRSKKGKNGVAMCGSETKMSPNSLLVMCSCRIDGSVAFFFGFLPIFALGKNARCCSKLEMCEKARITAEETVKLKCSEGTSFSTSLAFAVTQKRPGGDRARCVGPSWPSVVVRMMSSTKLSTLFGGCCASRIAM